MKDFNTLLPRTYTLVAILWIIAINVIVGTLTQGYVPSNGRHICYQPTRRFVNVKTTQSYCKPEYRRVVHKCRTGYGMCSTFRVFYRTAFRDVYTTRQTTQMAYDCCPGWEKYSSHDLGCMKAKCPNACQNGGRCVSPGTCQCTQGWMGRDCRTDVNECSKDNHGCMQKCENTIGGYRCSCYEGFNLDQDRKNCKLCLNCIAEYQQLKHSQADLKNKMDRLEVEKAQLERNVTNVLLSYQFAMENTANKYTEALREVKEVQREAIEKKIHQLLRSYRVTNKPITGGILDVPARAQPDPTKDSYVRSRDPPVAANLVQYQPDPYLEERLISLNDQIGLLEERLAQCNCNPDRREK